MGMPFSSMTKPENNLDFIDLMIFADAEVFVVRYAAALKGIGAHIVKSCRYLSPEFDSGF